MPWENFDILLPGGKAERPWPNLLQKSSLEEIIIMFIPAGKSTDVDRDGTNILSHDTVRSGTWFSVQDSQFQRVEHVVFSCLCGNILQTFYY